MTTLPAGALCVDCDQDATTTRPSTCVYILEDGAYMPGMLEESVCALHSTVVTLNP